MGAQLLTEGSHGGVVTHSRQKLQAAARAGAKVRRTVARGRCSAWNEIRVSLLVSSYIGLFVLLRASERSERSEFFRI